MIPTPTLMLISFTTLFARLSPIFGITDIPTSMPIANDMTAFVHEKYAISPVTAPT